MCQNYGPFKFVCLFVCFVAQHEFIGFTLLLDEVDQPTGGRILKGQWDTAIKFRLNFLSQLRSQLQSPLIKAVDVPADTLNEDLVLIHGDPASRNKWCENGEQSRVG